VLVTAICVSVEVLVAVFVGGIGVSVGGLNVLVCVLVRMICVKVGVCVEVKLGINVFVIVSGGI
jgi:hypothetical protein